MAVEAETMRIELEEVGARHWCAALLATLSSQYGNAYMRFVAVVHGEPRYVGSTFPVPRTWGNLPPKEEWAPGMIDSLTELQRQIEADGWQQIGCGAQAWESTYQRPGSPSPA